MSGRDRRSGGSDGAAEAPGGGAAAGKRALTDAVVQRSPAPGAPQLPAMPAAGGAGPIAGVSYLDELGGGVVQAKGMEDFGTSKPKSGFDRLPENLKPAEANDVSDRIREFRAALDTRDKATAQDIWTRTTDADRKGFAASPSLERELRQIHDVLGTDLVRIMEVCGLTFDGRAALLRTIIAERKPDRDWMEALVHHPSLWANFVDTLPERADMTEVEAQGLGTFIKRTGSETAARTLFARAYSPLADSSYDSAKFHARPWKIEWIRRLFDVIAEHLPVGHVRTVADFSVGYEYKEKKSDPAYKKLGHGWWNREGRHIVLPESSAEDGTKTTHNMSGGKGHGEVINKHDVTALHEVGHGVGQELGGNAWTEGYDFVGWQTGMNADTWSKGLWGDDDALTQAACDELGDDHTKVLPAAEARRWLAHSIAGTAYQVAAPKFRTTSDIERFIKKHYADEPLTDYHAQVKKDGRKDAYKFPGQQNIASDGRVYVYCSRGDNELSSYTEAAFKQKVSWYSLASVREWFAEQYATYYRTSPRGQGLEAGTRQKLDELHGAKYAPAAGVGNGLMKPGEGDDGGDGGASAPAAPDVEDTNDRLPFPW